MKASITLFIPSNEQNSDRSDEVSPYLTVSCVQIDACEKIPRTFVRSVGLFERSEFLIATCKKKKTDCVCGCSANLGFSVSSANRIRPKHGIPLSV